MSIIRKIKLTDKKDVLKISSQIWEGDDYVANVFDKWVKTEDGLFAGYWENDKLIGFGRMQYLSPVDVWLEALRKDPKTELSGVGYKIAKFYMQQLHGKHIRSVRFSTYFGNTASIKLNENLGFRKVLTLSLKELDISKHDEKIISENITQTVDTTKLYHFLLNSEYLKATMNFIGKGWVVHEFSKAILEDCISKKQFAVFKENDQVKGAVLFSEVAYKNTFWISLFEAETDAMFNEMLDFAVNKALQKKCTNIQILVPDDKELISRIDSSGFISWERDNDFLVYDLPKEIIDNITGVN